MKSSLQLTLSPPPAEVGTEDKSCFLTSTRPRWHQNEVKQHLHPMHGTGWGVTSWSQPLEIRGLALSTRGDSRAPPLLQTHCAGAAEEGPPVAATLRLCSTAQHSPPASPLPWQGCGQLRTTPVLLLFTKDGNGHTGGLPHHTRTNWDLSLQPTHSYVQLRSICSAIFYIFWKMKLGNEFKSCWQD